MNEPELNEREENKNDVRYQEWTEITLGCVGKHDQGLFLFCPRGSPRRSFIMISDRRQECRFIFLFSGGRRKINSVRGRGYVERKNIGLSSVLGGEKSPSGRICNPSVAPHLNRKPLREVRLEFSLTVVYACVLWRSHQRRSNGTLVTLTYTSVCSSCNFFNSLAFAKECKPKKSL